MDEELELEALAALAEGTRRELYAYVRQQARPVTRDQAAAHVGISRKLAAFHLDKLVTVGLLEAGREVRGEQGRLGRPPKSYRPSAIGLEVSVPPRRYELAARILLEAVEVADRTGKPVREAALEAARGRGRELGGQARTALRPGRVGPERALSLVERVAAGSGFEPVRADREVVRLGNCPFQRLAEGSPDLVCGMNTAFFTGIVEAIGGPVRVQLAPWPGHCCVQVEA
jgi:predicted ArsR family transcriptional regulator